MTLSQNQKTIIGAVILIALGIFIWSNFGSNTNTLSAETVNTDSTVGQDILSMVTAFQNVSIDGTLFSNQVFVSLRDFTVVLQPESQGRTNPFAPIGIDGSVPTQSGTLKKK